MKNYVSCILPHLFLGDLCDVNNHLVLKHLEIKKVISLVDESMKVELMDGVTYHTCEIDDSEDENIKQFFEECNLIILECEKTGLNVLVHCRAGISRSPTIVMAHLMLSKEMTRKDAFEHVSSKRFIIAPNDGFMDQLKELEYSD